MIVELLCRYLKDSDETSSQKIEEELNVRSLIQGDRFNEDAERMKLLKEERNFDYGPFLFNLADVMSANEIDEEHTYVRFHIGTAFPFKINYEDFKALYSSLTNQIINYYKKVDENGKPED